MWLRHSGAACEWGITMSVRRQVVGNRQRLNGKRWVAVLLCLIIGIGQPCGSLAAKKRKPLREFSAAAYNWGLRLNREHKKPGGSGPPGWKLKKDAAWYIGKHSKKDPVVYLTFDCGYEAGFTKKILNTLKKQKVKALFFVTKPYITQNPGIVKRMKKDGHLVGNHTSTHPRMAKLGTKQIRKEIRDCEREMKRLTGYEMDYFLRPPEGNFSIRSVKTAQRMGYATIFWSLAYVDWDIENQPSHDTAFDKLTSRIHPGAIVLLHNTSQTNGEILDELLTRWEEMGYRFGSLEQAFAG